MGQTSKLDHGEKHILKLIRRDQDTKGWTKVSKALFPHLQKFPKRLVEIVTHEEGGLIKLTDEGNAVIDAMEWL